MPIQQQEQVEGIPMLANMERHRLHTGTNSGRMCPPELQPVAQALLASLAKIDFEHESDIETVRQSAADDWLKQATIRTLQERHRARRAPYLRQLASLQKRFQARAA